MHKFQSEATDVLFQAIRSLQTDEEYYRFFEDLCTIKELQEMSQRFQIARLLSGGSNYQEITAETHVSTATISRVNKCLRYGSGGYRAAIEKMKSGEGT